MVYLYVLFSQEHLPMVPDEGSRTDLLGQMADVYGGDLGDQAKVLGSEVLDRAVPRHLEPYVSDAFLEAAARNGVKFGTDQIRLGYSVGDVDGVPTGVCFWQGN